MCCNCKRLRIYHRSSRKVAVGSVHLSLDLYQYSKAFKCLYIRLLFYTAVLLAVAGVLSCPVIINQHNDREKSIDPDAPK